MNIIGRKKEKDLIDQCLQSKRPEFLAIYGRRRTGKTYLVKEFLKDRFAFYATGVSRVSLKEELAVFHDALKQYGDAQNHAPKNWIEAFSRLRDLLSSGNVRRDSLTGKIVVFLDELPWMDTPRSDFKGALDYFWNSWGSSNPELLLIVCGSASSWIIQNILGDKGGFYNRITRQIHLKPFSLTECEELCRLNGIRMTKSQIVESYMIFGGIPYYFNLLDNRLGLAQNIDELFLNEDSELHYEYDKLFQSLFRKAEVHRRIIQVLAKRKSGLSRTEIVEKGRISSGEMLSDALLELEQCGFIRKYRCGASSKHNSVFQITDPFVLFHHHFISTKKTGSWSKYINSPGYHAWRGNAFEIVCLNHVRQIKTSLGISGVDSLEYAWRSRAKEGGAQIDLLIDRQDNVINICEMKFSNAPYIIDSEYAKKLEHKLEVFAGETKSKKALHLTMISMNGMAKNEYSGIINNVITGEELFQ